MIQLRIGRSRDNEIILDDTTVSKFHATLLIDNDKVTIQDNQSLNGTYVNGKRIRGMVLLQRNDIVKIGNSVLPWRNYLSYQGPTGKTQSSHAYENEGVHRGQSPSPGHGGGRPYAHSYDSRQKNNYFTPVIIALLLLAGGGFFYFFIYKASSDVQLTGTWDCQRNCDQLRSLILEKDGDRKTFRWRTDDDVLIRGKWKINDPKASIKKITFQLDGDKTWGEYFLFETSGSIRTFEYRLVKKELELSEILEEESFWNSEENIFLEKSN